MLNAELVEPSREKPGEVYVIARAEFDPQDWAVITSAAGIPGEVDVERLEELPTAAALERLSAVLWRVMDRITTVAADRWEAQVRAGQRLAYLVFILSAYPHATLTFVHTG